MKYWVHWNIIVEYEEIYSIMQSQFCIYSFPMSLIRIYVVKFCAGLQVSLYEDIFWNNALFMCATVEKVNLILKLPKYINYFFSSLSQDEKHKHELYNFVHRIQTQSNWTSYMDFPDLRCFLLHLSKMRKINKLFFPNYPLTKLNDRMPSPRQDWQTWSLSSTAHKVTGLLWGGQHPNYAMLCCSLNSKLEKKLFHSF